MMERRTRGRLLAAWVAASVLVTVSACNGGAGAGSARPAARAPGAASSASPASPSSEEPDRPGPAATVGESCRTGDPGHLCLGLKYVVYDKPGGQPGITQEEAVADIRGVNKVWSACNLGFEIEEYLAVDPAEYGLAYNTSTYAELDDIRNAFENDHTLLLVTTGTWNRGGNLGHTGANAWTAMPGSGPFGTVLELPVGKFANIIAHELGHYLNLLHTNDAADLMNPIIYSSSPTIPKSQCDIARAAASGFWQKMLR